MENKENDLQYEAEIIVYSLIFLLHLFFFQMHDFAC